MCIRDRFIGGAGVARGYLRRPELTAERFLADRFTPAPGARLYRTGDVVRYRADGTLEFLGRADHQVKVRGFRIELGEIEAVLAGHPSVAEAVVVAREDRPGDRSLAGYLRAAGAAPTGAELRAFLKERLPDYMVPGTFTVRDVLPLDDVGVDDNLFDVGGHSLLLVQVQAKLRDVLEREIAIVEMFQYPTIRAMATHLCLLYTSPSPRDS